MAKLHDGMMHKAISVWLNEQVVVGTAIAILFALLLAAGYGGWLPDSWVKKGHDKAAILLIAVGAGVALLGYLRRRAERIGTRSALAQFRAARIVAGIVVIGAAVVGTILIALLLAIWFGLFIVPLASGWVPGKAVTALMALDREPGTFIVAAVLVAVMGTLTAATYAYQRPSKQIEAAEVLFAAAYITLLPFFFMALAPLTAMFPVLAIAQIQGLVGYTAAEASEPGNLRLWSGIVMTGLVISILASYLFRRVRAHESKAKIDSLIGATIFGMVSVPLIGFLVLTAIWILRLSGIVS
jgi:hypothetical protein